MSGTALRPDGAVRGQRRCPVCRSLVAETINDVPVALMASPPRQVERYVRFVAWRCLRDEHHRGQYDTAVDELGGCTAWEVNPAGP